MMLMLKMLVLKMVKKYINIYKYEIESFWLGWHKTSKKPYFHCGPSSRTISKSAKKEKTKQKTKKQTQKKIVRCCLNLL